MLRFKSIATKSPNLSVPSFRMYRCITAPKIVEFTCNPTSLNASRNRSAFKIPLFNSYKYISSWFCLNLNFGPNIESNIEEINLRYTYLCPIFEYIMPDFKGAHEVFEVFKCNASHVSAVKCDNNLTTNFNTSAAFNVIWNMVQICARFD